jgi:uncharacterized protein
MRVFRERAVAANWAVVTGASSGIGAAIALELARRKTNILLTGRDETRLAEIAAQVRALGVEALSVAADLSTGAGVKKLCACAAEHTLRVEILVNNAGSGWHGPFAKSTETDNARMTDVQIGAALQLTQHFLPGMIERRGGKILTVASVYAFSPVPNQAVYAACKTFLLSWTRTLSLELIGTGVSASVLCPGITLTRFRSRAGMKEKKSAFAMDADAVALIAVNGLLRGKTVIVPGWHNRLYTTLAGCLPAGTLGRFTRWFNRRRGLAETSVKTNVEESR